MDPARSGLLLELRITCCRSYILLAAALSLCYSYAPRGGIAQLVERTVRIRKARGSNPRTSTFLHFSLTLRASRRTGDGRK